MFNFIAEIIKDFDPLELMPFAPEDEYYNEIIEIYDFINSCVFCDVDMLAQQIYQVFLNHLGADIFVKSVDDCKCVAQKILLHN